MIVELSELVEKCKFHKRVFIYGVGNYGKRVRLFLEQNGITVFAYLKTNKMPEDIKFKTTPIFDIKEVEIGDEDYVLVSVADRIQPEIISVLKKKKVREYELITKIMYEEIVKTIDYRNEKSVMSDKFIQVLLFHRVIEKSNDPWRLEIRPEIFEEYIKYIANNYNVKRFEDDWKDVSEKTIVITFDDGYWDNYEYALPILERYKVPATIFVSTGNLDKTEEFWWDCLARLVPTDSLIQTRNELRKLTFSERKEVLNKIELSSTNCSKPLVTDRSLNEEELKRMSESEYITIGGHTVTHNALLYQSEEEQRFEIQESKNVLERIIGKKITTFSYPFGQRDTYSDTTIRLLKECEIKKAASTIPELVGENYNPYEIPRIGQPEVSLEEFVRKLEEKWYMEG